MPILLFVAYLLTMAATAHAASTEWTNRAVPKVGGTFEEKLGGVSCTSATACTSVGWSSLPNGAAKAPMAVRWDGEKLALQTVPSPLPFNFSNDVPLSGVSCASATACMAVGSANPFGSVKPLAESWNGTSWEIKTTPTPEKAESASLAAVSCTSASACTAVGSYKVGGVTKPLAERWNGTSWAIQSIASPEQGSLNGVSCVTATSCTAVGAQGNKPLAERWNGTSWSAQTPASPEKSSEARLDGVSCTTTACVAVGYNKDAFGNKSSLTERSTGGAWEIQTAPVEKFASESSLSGVSCLSASSVCQSTGSFRPTVSSSYKALGDRFESGKWELDQPITPAGFLGELSLPGVSCPTTTWCMTTGYNREGAGTYYQPLAETAVRIP